MRGASAFMVSLFALSAFAGEVAAGKFEALKEKPRLFVLTDLANEPDDEESLVRLFAYANEFDIEGLVATTSWSLRENPREDLIHRTIDAYEKVVHNLRTHASGYPDAEYLHSVTATGQNGLGMDAVSEATPGSRLLAAAILREDAASRPLWITVWGGANTLLRALRDLRDTVPEAKLQAAVRRLKVYMISDQDDSGTVIRKEFPSLECIVDPFVPYEKTTWRGISGDIGGGEEYHLPYREMVENDWLQANIIDIGPLGACYPRHLYFMEGDTPSFLGLIENGLGWSESPSYGGWGGRYEWRQHEWETHPVWMTPSNPDEYCGQVRPGNSITRWREEYQSDFAARMRWSVTPKYEDANHNPVAVLNGDRTKGVVRIAAKRGDKVALSAEGSSDPDGDAISFEWSIYREAGTLAGGGLRADGARAVLDLSAIPEGSSGSIHVILRVRDSGTPTLFAYRRVIVEVDMAPLSS